VRGASVSSRRALRSLVACVAACAGLLVPAAAAQADVYFSLASTIGKTEIDGTGKNESFLNSGGGPRGIALYGDDLYWVTTAGNIGHATIDSAGDLVGPPEPTFITGANVPDGLAISPDGTRLYWSNFGSFGVGESVGSAQLDAEGGLVAGTVNHAFITGLDGPRGVATDGQFVYVANSGTDSILRAPAAGGAASPFITNAAIASPEGIAVNAGNIYWGNSSGFDAQSVGRQQLDPVTRNLVPGTFDNDFIADTLAAAGLALDNRYLYFTELDASVVGRAELDAEGDLVGDPEHDFIEPNGFPLMYAVAVNRSASTEVTCAPEAPTPGVAVTCTAEVSDVAGGTPAAPAGSVRFSSPAAGTFDPATCELGAADTDSSTCAVTFTASATGDAVVTGTYRGNRLHTGDSGDETVEVIAPNPTSTAVSCDAPIDLGEASICTVTVSDTGAEPSTPGGTVSFGASGSGAFSPAAECSLAPVDVSSASCSVDYAPAVAGTQTVTASYAGEPRHLTSSGQDADLLTIGRESYVAVSCAPTALQPGETSTCEVTVIDAAAGGSSSPTGLVSFTSNGGSLAPAACTLTPGGEGEASCGGVVLTAGAAGSHSVTASYAGDDLHAAATGTASLLVATPPGGSPPGGGPGGPPKGEGGKAAERRKALRKCKKQKSKKARRKCISRVKRS
jgi:hypothetical protein